MYRDTLTGPIVMSVECLISSYPGCILLDRLQIMVVVEQGVSGPRMLLITRLLITRLLVTRLLITRLLIRKVAVRGTGVMLNK